MPHWSDRHRAILSVYLILQKRSGEVLLLLRQNTGYKDGEYGLPTGHVDGGETVTQAMIREAKEEIGVTVEEKDLEFIQTMHRNCGDHERVDFFFVCKSWHGEPKNTEPEKCGELSWHSLDALPENTIDYYKHMFQKWQAGETLTFFGWE